jgi:CHAD domain-containing protein
MALLALDDGQTQVEAGRRAGLSDRQVRHWLASYRREGLAIYGAVHAAMEAAAGSVRAARTVPVTAVQGGAPDEPAALPAGAEAGASAAPHAAECAKAGGPVLPEAEAPAAEEPSPAGAGPGEAPAAPHEKKRPKVHAADTMTAAAVETLRFHLDRMLEHEEGTRLGEDPEELHDMRVSTRRMRMALRVFADFLDPAVMRPVRKGLRRTGATLGAVRDLDVFYEKTRHYLDGLPEERGGDLDGLLEAWHGEREKQREHLVAYLDGTSYRRFVETMREVLDRPLDELAPRDDGVLRPQRVAQVLPGILYQDLGAVWVFEGQTDGLRTPLTTFHMLRKACKGLRYTLEFFEGVLGPGAKPLIKAVKGLQDHLGDLQDAVVTCGILRDYITWGEWRHHGHTLPEPTELIIAPGAARYMAARQEEMERLVLTFPDVWPTVAGPEFSRRMATVIAEI